MRRLLAVLFWSAISAAFLGPGTIATASRAGATHGYELIWALVFSTAACWALQEAAARVTIHSGRSLGELIADWAASGSGRGRLVARSVAGAVVVGCAAYQAGNILGAREGLLLAVDVPAWLATLVCGAGALIVLSAGSRGTIAHGLGLIVAAMGIAFAWCALEIGPDVAALAEGALVPRTPAGSGTLLLGLVGTTIVPYNLFLGSALARGRSGAETRFALSIAIPAGGAISIAVLVCSTSVAGSVDFAGLADALELQLGSGARHLFSVGLFAAGFSSAITAPLAAGLTWSSVATRAADRPRTARVVALSVLFFGLAVGLSGVDALPVILLAQALNGLILPLVGVTLLVAVSDRTLLGARGASGPFGLAAVAISVAAATMLGADALVRAGSAAAGAGEPSIATRLAVALPAAAALVLPALRTALRRRRGGAGGQSNSAP